MSSGVIGWLNLECAECLSSRLKSELSWLRKKGAIKAGQQESSFSRSCGRCHSELGLIMNRGALCPSCGQRVCKQCREYISTAGTDWVCLVCRKQIEIQIATGEWMNDFIRRPSRRRGRSIDTPGDLIKKALVKRSWTISSPPGVGREVDPPPITVNESPQKPPRRSIPPTDENKPPYEYKHPAKPSRRYSMSSYDGLSLKARCSRDTTSEGSSPIRNGYSPYSSPNRHPQPECQKYYFFGTDLPVEQQQRPSTLPRKPHHQKVPLNQNNSSESVRFHSIPRNKPRQETGQRGQSEPPRLKPIVPLRENHNHGRHTNLGPVTSTPLVPDNCRHRRSRSPRYVGGGPAEPAPNLSISKSREFAKPLSASSSLVETREALYRRIPREKSSPEYTHGDGMREDEGGGRWREARGGMQQKHLQRNLYDSGRSGSSNYLTPDMSDDSDERVKALRTFCTKRLPRSNTSISSGAATTGRPKKKTSPNLTPVRRCKSFQAESSRPVIEKRTNDRGQVARYVQELEKGIQYTVANMASKKNSNLSLNTEPSRGFRDLGTSPPVSRSSSNSRNTVEQLLPNDRRKSFENEERQPSQASDNSSSDIHLDSNKIIPGENDYKIVFISSDSSKDSEANSSIDSDNPVTPPRKRSAADQSETDLTEDYGSEGEDRRFVKRRKSLKEQLEKRFVDASVMTEEDFISDASLDADIDEDSSLLLSLRVPSPEAKRRGRDSISGSRGDLPMEKKDHNLFTHPLEALGAQELRAMLQQTETVQAEAEALKWALMGAFEPKNREFLAQQLALPPSNRKSDNCHLSRSQPSSKVQLETPVEIPKLAESPNSDMISHDRESKTKDYNLYENIEIMQQQHKTVCTQTDPIPSSEEDEYYETADDSDISSDSLHGMGDTPPPALISPLTLPDQETMLHSTTGNGRKEPNQDVSSPPFYLSATPPHFPARIHNPPTPPHLRLTLNRPQPHSVLLSSGGESVDRLQRLVGEKSVRDALVKSDQKANPLSKNSEFVSDSLCGEKFVERKNPPKRKEIHPLKERSNGDSPSILASSSSHSAPAASHLTNRPSTLRPFKPPPPVPFVVPTKKTISDPFSTGMSCSNAEKKGGHLSNQDEGDINATKKVICPQQDTISVPSVGGALESCSSSASDEDTDEDVHISRSYDVSVELEADKDLELENPKVPDDSICFSSAEIGAESNEKESSTSDSETDEEAHSYGEYAVTKVSSSSDSDKENENNCVSSLTKEKSSAETSLDEEQEEEELPECDQALSESALKNSNINNEPEVVSTGLPLDNCDISHVSSNLSSNSCATSGIIKYETRNSIGESSDETPECVAESKSETESNIGLDSEIQELSTPGTETNSNEKFDPSKEDFSDENISSGDSDREFVRLERELSRHDENDETAKTSYESSHANNSEDTALPSDKIPLEAKATEQNDRISNSDQEESAICNISSTECSLETSSLQEEKKEDLIKCEIDNIDGNLNSKNDECESAPLSCEGSAIESKESVKAETNEPLESSNPEPKVTAGMDAVGTHEEGQQQESGTGQDALHQISDNQTDSATTKITGSTEVEQASSTSCSGEPVALDKLSDADAIEPLSKEKLHCVEVCENFNLESDIIEGDNITSKLDSSDSGESEKDGDTTVTIDKELEAKGDEFTPAQTPSLKSPESDLIENKQLQNTNTSVCSPPVPIRRAKRSSSSDGLSSSSDIERSDADISDSADTIIDGTHLRPLSKLVHISDVEEDLSKDSDRPSSADSVLESGESEYQGSDGSEEGNLISIVAVGEENPRKSSQGKIYIRSDSTDSDVQIKPTCIVVTGSSGIESGEEDGENEQAKPGEDADGNDVTILEVTSGHRKDHVMSVRVTSPESSRSTSPARNRVSELQSMILTTRESQQQVRCSPNEIKESSSLANYFTVTLGTSSPLTPRRTNKTPEIRRRKFKERNDSNESPIFATTPTPTLTPSPSHTPSPTLTPTPDHSEGDLLAYEENFHPNKDHYEDEYSQENTFEFYDENLENYDEFEDMQEIHMDHDDIDVTFDSIEDAESLGESNYSETSSEDGYERDDEIRGFAKRAYSFTLHTIIEESCEESDYEKRNNDEEAIQRDPSELEKYFYFGLGNGPDSKKFANEESEYSDTFSESSSSAFSEGMESLDQNAEEEIDPAELASSRLEKYFSGFLNFERQPSIRSVGEESEIHTDESGSVGSDSEGSASPEQPRKKLFKTRGVRAGGCRSHGYSSDKGEGVISDGSHNSGEGDENDKTLVSGEDEISTESEEIAFEKSDGQFDTIKRRKKKKMLEMAAEKKIESEKTETKQLNEKEDSKKDISQKLLHSAESSNKKTIEEVRIIEEILKDGSNNDSGKTSQNKDSIARDGSAMNSDLAIRKYQSRDSGFIGSSDDLLKDKPEDSSTKDSEMKERSSESSTEEIDSKKPAETEISERKSIVKDRTEPKLTGQNAGGLGKSESDKSSTDGKVSRSSTGSSADLPPYTNTKGAQNLSRKDSFNNWSSDEETNLMMNRMRLFFKNMFSNTSRDVPKGQRVKSPQLVMFEAKLTSLMRTVPGINDEQVKEIVEYLSSEETWSDSYDSSDYTSSDLEGAYARLDVSAPESRSELQEQISASCQQIINKFDRSKDIIDIESGGDNSSTTSKDTMFVYQKVFSSLSIMKADSDRGSVGSGSQSTSPPLLAKVMHHIGNRFVALMHEVSAGSENGDDVDSFNGGQLATSSPRPKLFLPKKHKATDSISFDSSVDKSSLTSNSFESEESPTDTEQSPESEIGTPKAIRHQRYSSLISEKSSGEDFTSLESQRTVFASHEYSRQPVRHESTKSSLKSSSQRSLEDRTVSFPQYFGYDSRNKNSNINEIDDDQFDVKGVPKMTRSNRRVETRKAKSQMNLEKIHHDDVKNTGERSESLGDLLDRVRSSDYSSSYEQLDSDSTLKASDSLDRHISSSSSNVRLNASSRGSLTTSSRGSLAASSRGSLNASSRGSLQGSSGPDDDIEDKKSKKFSFLRHPRRCSVPESPKEPSPELRSTTLPRSNPAQILATGTMPRSQPSQSHTTRSSTGLFSNLPSLSPERHTSTAPSGPPRSARYHAPGYRPPPSNFLSKRTVSTPVLRNDKLWHSPDESVASIDDGVGPSVSASSASFGSLHKAGTTSVPFHYHRGAPFPRGGVITSPTSSRAASPLGESLKGSIGRTSTSNASATGSIASFETSPDEEDPTRKFCDGPDGRRTNLSSLGQDVGFDCG